MANVAQRKPVDEERGERKDDWDREAVLTDEAVTPLLPDYLQPRRMLPFCEMCMQYTLLTTLGALFGAVIGAMVGVFMMIHRTSLGTYVSPKTEEEEWTRDGEFMELIGVATATGALMGVACSLGLKVVCKTAMCMRATARVRRFMQTCEI
jgi:hypothetical protein